MKDIAGSEPNICITESYHHRKRKEYLLNNPDYYEHHFGYGMYLRNKYIHNKIEGAVMEDVMSENIFDKIIALLKQENEEIYEETNKIDN